MTLAVRVATRVLENDAALVERAQSGDDHAFSQIYRLHARYIAGVAYRLLGNDAELDDVVQETFIAASRALAHLREPSLLRRWLVTIAVRRVHRRLAQRRLRRWLGHELETTSPRSSDPRARAQADALYCALDRLSPKLRVPWVLHRIEGEALPDVAKLCELSLATVKRRIADADARIDRRLHAD